MSRFATVFFLVLTAACSTADQTVISFKSDDAIVFEHSHYAVTDEHLFHQAKTHCSRYNKTVMLHNTWLKAEDRTVTEFHCY